MIRNLDVKIAVGNKYNVTIAPGTGAVPNAFYLNGLESPAINLLSNCTYKFIQSDGDATLRFYNFDNDEEYSTGVTRDNHTTTIQTPTALTEPLRISYDTQERTGMG